MTPAPSAISWIPDLDGAINKEPLIVTPETLLIDVINLFSERHNQPCVLDENMLALELQARKSRASCILVGDGSNICGIVTERDIVRLTAAEIDFATVVVSEVMIQPVITLPYDSLQDIFAVLFLFRRYRIRHLPIVDAQDQLLGVISQDSIRQVLRPANLLRFRRVSDVMTTPIIHASLTCTALDIGRLMAKHRVSCVVITQEDSDGNFRPVGIITERDILQFKALRINLTQTSAETIMSTPLFLLQPEDSLWTAHQEMQKRRVGRLVVSWNWGQNLGIVTQTSLLRIFDPIEMYGVIENLQQTIQQLETKGTSNSQSNNSLQDNKVASVSQSELSGDLPQTDIKLVLKDVELKLQSLADDKESLSERQRLKLQNILQSVQDFDVAVKP